MQPWMDVYDNIPHTRYMMVYNEQSKRKWAHLLRNGLFSASSVFCIYLDQYELTLLWIKGSKMKGGLFGTTRNDVLVTNHAGQPTKSIK